MSTQSRVAAGVPTGGRFATTSRAEAGVGLDATPRPTEFLARRAELAESLHGSSKRKGALREARTRRGIIVPSDAARAVGRFNPDGPLGYRAKDMPDAPLRATRQEAEDDWLDAQTAGQVGQQTGALSPEQALAPALDMNRVQAERHVRSLIDQAVAEGDPARIDQIASLASGRGWAGVAYVRAYPHTSNPECGPSDYLPTKAAATRTAEYAWARTVDAERRAQTAQTQTAQVPAGAETNE